ncbi:hypothetical protein niasHT_024209 [Heterodera trifolii]|uniref:Uncharacterized protein n=1 Tax=Heterodera trifolii TaxID=157864 RepID=A0ABD2JM44_9BILA
MNIYKTRELLERRRSSINISETNTSGVQQVNLENELQSKIVYRQSKIDQLEKIKMITCKIREAAAHLGTQQTEDEKM